MKKLSVLPCTRLFVLLATGALALGATGCGDDSATSGPSVVDNDATGGGLDGNLGGSDGTTTISQDVVIGIDVIVPGTDVATGGGDDVAIATDIQPGADVVIGVDTVSPPDISVGVDSIAPADISVGPDAVSPPDISIGGSDGGVSPIVSCVESACPGEVATCEADAACAKVLDCAKNCTDQNCLFGCVGGGGGGFNLPNGLQAVYTCGNSAKCFQGGGGGPTNPTCGNGKCDAGETTANCPADCPAAGGGGANSCAGKCGQINTGGGYTGCQCQNGCEQAGNCCSDYQALCGSGGTTPTCGDGKCDTGETAASCPADCGGGTTTTPDQCVQAKCATQYASCAKDPACLTALPCVEGGKQIWNCNVTSVQTGLTLGQLQGCATQNKCF